jgi:hypothetical protein
MRRFPILVVVALVGASCGGSSANAPRLRMSAKDIYKTASPAIVRLEVGDDKMGTGFIVDKTGLIATSLHVIVGEAKIKVHTYADGEYWVQSVAALDREHDLALVRIKVSKPLPVVSLGDSAQLSPGDVVYAVGNPLGVFDYSITDGLISAVRPWKPNVTFLQISAPISPGSSGGPLFNQYGEVVGMTHSIIAPTDPHITVENINMAIPVNYLKPMLKQQTSISVNEFAKQTHEDEAKIEDEHVAVPSAGTPDPALDTTPPPRHVPEHELTIWDGCKPKDIEDTFKQVESAIESGAPAYNRMNAQGFEECFRIYEGTGLRMERTAACKGVRDAFGDGLLRASAITSYKDKAWAMRDAFDGLMLIAAYWCLQNQQSCTKDAPSVFKLLESQARRHP